jgi:uncharacterized protein YdaU (DUF1376 family)
MHYYKFNIADYRKDTGHLSIIEHGIYRQLIDWYYLDEQPIPEETQVVIRRLRLGSDEVNFLQNILSDFFVLGKTGYKHKRIEVEIKDYHEQVEKNKNNGRLGGRPKKTQSVISGLPDESQNNPNHKPITTNHKPKKEKATDVAAPIGVSSIVWFEFVALRKSKKSSVTQTVLDGLQKEADKAGWTLEQVLKEIILRNWQSFKADWVQPRQTPVFNKFDVANVTTPPPPNQDAALRKIEADRKNAVPPSLETLAKLAELRKGVTE